MKIYSILAGFLVCIGLLVGSYGPLFAESPDNKLPIITTTNPEGKTIGVDVNIPISITFSEDIEPSTLTPDTFYLTSLDNGGESIIPGRVEYDAAIRTAYLRPADELSYSTNYVVIVSGVKTLSGKTLESEYTWGFTTRNGFAGCGGS